MLQSKISRIRWAVGINLFLWLAAFGAVMAPPVKDAIHPGYFVGAGVLFSALIEHWAYRRLGKYLSSDSTAADT